MVDVFRPLTFHVAVNGYYIPAARATPDTRRPLDLGKLAQPLSVGEHFDDLGGDEHHRLVVIPDPDRAPNCREAVHRT